MFPRAASAAEQALEGRAVQASVGPGDGLGLTAEKLLVAVGRRAELADLGLDTVGLDPHVDAIKVGEHMRAGDDVWAVGDVTGHGAFTHVATYQAAIAARDILREPGSPADYRALPGSPLLIPKSVWWA